MNSSRFGQPIHIGGFQELSLDERDPLLHEVIGRGAYSEPAQVARYLRRNRLLAVAPQLPRDYLTGELGKGGGAELRTDGEFTWDARLAYYVEEYRIALPDDFVRQIEAHIDRDLRGL